MNLVRHAASLSCPEDNMPASRDQFSFTSFWKRLVAHTRKHVEVKRHQVWMKTYENCFTGCDAVDVIFYRLRTEKNLFTQDVTREKACKLCQLMLDSSILESVNGADKFEDCSSKLFRFTIQQEDNVDDEVFADSSTLADFGTDSIFRNPKQRVRKLSAEDFRNETFLNNVPEDVQSSLEQQWSRRLTLSGFVGHKSSRPAFSSNRAESMTPSKRLSFRRSLWAEFTTPKNRSKFYENETETTDVEPDVKQVVREEALSKLTTLMEIPLLDDILQTAVLSTVSSSSVSPFTPKKECLQRYENMATIMSNDNWRTNDEFWLTGVKCLEFVSYGLKILDFALCEKTPIRQKLRIYQGISDHYAGRLEPLWPCTYGDVHLGLYRLLMKGDIGNTVRALRLAVTLLDEEVKIEIKCLLEFLQSVLAATNIQLSVAESNQAVIEKKFGTVLIKDKVLTRHQVGQLVIFMVNQVQQLWDTPHELLNAVDIVTGSSFCMKISTDEYEQQKRDQTAGALVQMMKSTLANVKTTMKEKKQRLQQFRKHHPDLYSKHFDGVRLSL